MPLQSYQQLTPDPEGTSAAFLNSAAAVMEPGSVVWKNGRAYLYVLVDSGATVPGNGGLFYWKSAPNATTFTVTNGANGITNNSNHALVAAGMQYYAITAGNYGFIQVGGPSFVAPLFDPGVTLVGQVVVSNLSNTTTPAQMLLLSSTNVVFSNVVGQVTSTTPTNAVLLSIAPYGGA